MYKGLAVADTAFAAECEADSLSDPSDIKHLGDDCVGVNLHENATCCQHPKMGSSASTTSKQASKQAQHPQEKGDLAATETAPCG